MIPEVDMDLLIDLIQQYPYLYDIRDKSYKNNDLKEKCWEAISIQVNVPGIFLISLLFFFCIKHTEKCPR